MENFHGLLSNSSGCLQNLIRPEKAASNLFSARSRHHESNSARSLQKCFSKESLMTSKDAEKGARVLNCGSRNGRHKLHANFRQRAHVCRGRSCATHQSRLPGRNHMDLAATFVNTEEARMLRVRVRRPRTIINNSRAKRSRPREYFANVRIAHEPLIPTQALEQKTLEKT